jgi:hypothetical protein
MPFPSLKIPLGIASSLVAGKEKKEKNVIKSKQTETVYG